VAQDSGEGRWTVQAAIDHAVPMPVISAALFARFASRQEDSPAMEVAAALRNQFGGHAVTAPAADHWLRRQPLTAPGPWSGPCRSRAHRPSSACTRWVPGCPLTS
jgi:6-phosphogluconate dehydrogenase, C-terminal domain